MLEILFVVFMCRRMAAMLRAKGRKPVGYCTVLVLCWILGEVLGGIIGAIAFSTPRDGFNAMIYVCAVVGAGLGALGAFAIARSVSSLIDRPTGGFPVIQRQPPIG